MEALTDLLSAKALKQISTLKSRPILLAQKLFTLVTMSILMLNVTVYTMYLTQQPQMVLLTLTVIQEASQKPYPTLFCLSLRSRYQHRELLSVLIQLVILMQEHLFAFL